MIKLCVDERGAPALVELVRGSGFDDVDEADLRHVHAWRFEPYKVDGVAVPLCTAIMFRYAIGTRRRAREPAH